jgi:hypothetical protein
MTLRAGSLISALLLLVPLATTACGSRTPLFELGVSGTDDGGRDGIAPCPPSCGGPEFDAPRPPTEDGGFPDGELPDVEIGPFDGAFPPESGPNPDVVSIDVFVPDAGFPATHPAMPSDPSSGGPVLSTPNLIPVFYTGDSEQTTLTDMLTNLGASPYWSATTSEYGVSGATLGTSIVLTTAAPTSIDDSAIQSWLQTNLDGSDTTWGTPGPEDVFILFYPSTTLITLDGYKSCSYFGGYHNETSGSTGIIHYAVLPRCSGIDGLTAEQELTFALSHEIVEATTDPQPYTDPAYVDPDNNDVAWGIIAGGELADMCEFVPNIQITPAAPFDYTVQRTWSNASAAASHDPCVPIPAGEVYFNSAPVMGDTISLDQGFGPFSTVGVEVALGGSKTIPVDLYSDGPTSGPWTIQAVDVASQYNGEATALTFSFDKTSGENGDVVHLTINAVRKDPMYGGEIFILVSTLGGMQTLWFGAVGN